MSNDLVNLKQSWIQTIEPHILTQGFQKSDIGYERVKVARKPGQTISINGRVMHQPGEEIEIRQNIC